MNQRSEKKAAPFVAACREADEAEDSLLYLCRIGADESDIDDARDRLRQAESRRDGLRS